MTHFWDGFADAMKQGVDDQVPIGHPTIPRRLLNVYYTNLVLGRLLSLTTLLYNSKSLFFLLSALSFNSLSSADPMGIGQYRASTPVSNKSKVDRIGV